MFQFIYNLIGKDISKKIGLTEETVDTKKWYLSKTIWIAVISGVLTVLQAVGAATGHPIVIPSWVYGILTSLGLYTARTADTTII